MVTQKKLKDALSAGRDHGNAPYQKAGRLLVRTNAPAESKLQYRVLAQADGELTPAGRTWQDMVGPDQPLLTTGTRGQTFQPDQPTQKRGASEYITLRSGKEAIVRTWDGQKFLYTQMGQAYFAKRPSKHIVEVPVTIRGRRSANEAERGNRGRAGDYTREAYMPVSHFGIGEIFQKASAANLEAKIKTAVLK